MPTLAMNNLVSKCIIEFMAINRNKYPPFGNDSGLITIPLKLMVIFDLKWRALVFVLL